MTIEIDRVRVEDAPAHVASSVNRRNMLRSIVAAASLAPAIAVASPAIAAAPNEEEIERLGAAVAEAQDSLVGARARLHAAERAMHRWALRSPKPCRLDIEGDPSADLKAAVAEHSAALAEWGARKSAADMRCGYTAAKRADLVARDQAWHAMMALVGVRATTLAGIKMKAALLGAIDGCIGHTELAWSIVDDLNGIPGING